MKIWIAIAIIVLFAMAFALLQWPRRDIKTIIRDLSWRDFVGFALLIVAFLMTVWARRV
jgi:hypothetical protein